MCSSSLLITNLCLEPLYTRDSYINVTAKTEQVGLAGGFDRSEIVVGDVGV